MSEMKRSNRATRRSGKALSFAAVVAAFIVAAATVSGEQSTAVGQSGDPFAVEFDVDVAVRQGGPHDGGGTTTGHAFFEREQNLEFVFKKRVLHPGSAIGLHTQRHNEVYYVLSGAGRYTMDEKEIDVGPGTALLTKPGGSHALRQVGDQDLVLIIVYPRH